MNWADQFDGSTFIQEEDGPTIEKGHPVNQGRHLAATRSNPLPPSSSPPPPARSTDPHENIRAWLSGVTIDEESKSLAADVFHALDNRQHPATPLASGYHQPAADKQQAAETGPTVNVHTMGPGFIGRAPAFGSSEFFANMVVVAILLLFAPGFTLLAAGVFFTSRVAERWAGQD
ncbi:hypothetical protein CORC01_05216 [Colletotrichum orchidophilum]|uniref:Uncharacterized protein n=1 Tax=Colletotrichum orchidophilum TaxID=1209926 RepID=A0A1G4BDK1_9PEZI|nr:uncharacterized protein CORC01_05216 [Colletotrichum orchidophilum]OHE99416.1 hypothetical protein CORC01_05216 [Colletotrichum orchidophilum]